MGAGRGLRRSAALRGWDEIKLYERSFPDASRRTIVQRHQFAQGPYPYSIRERERSDDGWGNIQPCNLEDAAWDGAGVGVYRRREGSEGTEDRYVGSRGE